MPFDNPSYMIVFTKITDPPYEQWLWKMHNSHRIAWLNSNEGLQYNFLILKISRIADYYFFYHNRYVIHGDAEYIDVQLNDNPSVDWKDYEKKMHDELQINRFKYFSEEMSSINLDFLVEYNYDSIPPDDERWDDIDYMPPLEPASLHRCLFSD